jgi:hypothetical protein
MISFNVPIVCPSASASQIGVAAGNVLMPWCLTQRFFTKHALAPVSTKVLTLTHCAFELSAGIGNSSCFVGVSFDGSRIAARDT